MTKKEKLERLFCGSPVDSPVLFQPILMHFAARFNGNTYAQFASDYKVLVDCNIRALEYFDMDMVGLISDPYRETSAFGAKIEYVEEGVPRCLASIVRNQDDVNNLKIPDPYKEERTADRIKGAGLFQKLLRGTVPVYGWIEGPLAEACDLAGVGDMLINLMIEPDFCNSLIDKCMITARDFAKAQIEAGCDIMGIGDAICSQINLDTYNLYVKERHKELVDYIHSLNAKVKMHICGDITHLLPSLKDLNIDILDLDWKVNPETAYSILGDNVVRCGNINPVDIQDKNEEELASTAGILLRGEIDRKFILSGGCEITVNTPVQNLTALRKAAVH
jgi:MtaA/CmuA family methyltransferase